MIVVDELKKALPGTMQNMATQAMADQINMISNDPEMARVIGENFISYISVMRDGRYKTEDYLTAVVYVTHKHMGYTNLDAYVAAFPQRYQKMVSEGKSSKDIAAYVSMYNKGKLVNALLEQSLIPVWLINQHVYQKAINIQVDILQDPDVSPKVRSDAANSILTHLGKPKEAVANINVGIQVDTGMKDLEAMLTKVAEKQLAAIESGVTARDIAAMPLIENQTIEGEAKRVFD